MNAIPKAPGTYVLWLKLDAPAQVSIGRLGVFDFPAGVYAYVGSAFGPGGLRGRLKHHLSPVKKPHWHIDYLRQAAPCVGVSFQAHPERYEHAWAATLASLPGVGQPVRRFGASDCQCESHLLHFACALPSALNQLHTALSDTRYYSPST